jgi:Thiamine pyrophosphate enzyme, N-terminal TPP binding domain
MNGAQALFKALTDAGLDTCFANPGTSEMQLVYEMGRTKDARAVLCLEENVVTGAADGYARMAGKPAFTLLHAWAAVSPTASRTSTMPGGPTRRSSMSWAPTRPTTSTITLSMNSSTVKLIWHASCRIGRTKPNRPATWQCLAQWWHAIPGSAPGRSAPWSPRPTATGTRRWLRRSQPRPWRHPESLRKRRGSKSANFG